MLDFLFPVVICALTGTTLALLPWSESERASTERGLVLIARRVIGWVVG